MSKIDELIEKLCPKGVEFKKTKEIKKESFWLMPATPHYINEGIPYITSKNIRNGIINFDDVNYISHEDYINISANRKIEKNDLLVTMIGTIGETAFVGDMTSFYGQNMYLIRLDDNLVNRKFYNYYLTSPRIKDSLVSRKNASSQGYIKAGSLEELSVPVPPMEVQDEIVHILDDFTLLSAELSAELKARQKQYEYYKGKLFKNQNIELKTLKELAINCDNQRKPVTSGNREKGEYPYYGASGIVDYVKDYIFDGDYLLISEDGANLVARKTPIAFSISGKNWVNNHAHVLKFDNMYLQKYVEMYLNYINIDQYISGAAQPKLNQENLNKIAIPIPDEDTLMNIVDVLTIFDRITNDILEGLPAEIEARQKQYEYYRDKLLTFKELANEE